MSGAASVRDPLLFTPGPLTTSPSVKAGMARDLGSRTPAFVSLVASIRESLLEVAEVRGAGYESVLLQGSGTFGIEAVLGSVTPPAGRWLVVSNGVYGDRIHEINSALGIASERLALPPEHGVDAAEVGRALDRDDRITHVALVHGETSTGIVNRIDEISEAVRIRRRCCLVDAMSTFGSVPIRLRDSGVDYLVSSPNKSLEGVPGFSFVIARRSALEEARGLARSVSLDLFSQWRAFEETGQFRFTPPVQALLAFELALRELAEEGGVARRGERYRENHAELARGMASLGFERRFETRDLGDLIHSYLEPAHPAFDFDRFFESLLAEGFVIYPGALEGARYFRIGTMGRIGIADVRRLLEAIPKALESLGVDSAAGARTPAG